MAKPAPPKTIFNDNQPNDVLKALAEEVVVEEPPAPPAAPAAVDPTAVETTESGLKFGWQQEASRPEKDTAPCMHTGVFQARQQVAAHEVGHEWACPCGVLFEVVINAGDKKTLKEKPVG